MTAGTQYIAYQATEDEKRKFLSRTYGWMAFALVISAATAYFVSRSQTLLSLLWGGKAVGFWVLAISEVALVFILSMNVHKFKPLTVKFFFVLYAVINGATLASVFALFDMHVITQAFLCAALLYASMSLFGMKTGKNLASWGRYLLMALLGLVIVGVVNMVITLITKQTLTWIDWVIDIATIVIFTGLTAYDSQKILRAAEHADGSEAFQKLAVYGALDLYLDFINIFLAILRIFGRVRRS